LRRLPDHDDDGLKIQELYDSATEAAPLDSHTSDTTVLAAVIVVANSSDNPARILMTCTLILMRHSHAVDEYSCRDFDRQLTGAGIQLANETGRLLNELNIMPDVIVTSAAARTVATGRCVAEQFESDIPVVPRHDLYQAGSTVYLPAIQSEAKPDSSTLLAIGHNPGIGSLMSGLAGRNLAVSPATTGVYSIGADDWHEFSVLSNMVARLTHLIINAKRQTDF
jgi:phosphohistidine phosphatase